MTSSAAGDALSAESGLRIAFWAWLLRAIGMGLGVLFAGLGGGGGEGFAYLASLFEPVDLAALAVLLFGVSRWARATPGGRRALAPFGLALALRAVAFAVDAARPSYDAGPLWGPAHLAIAALGHLAALAFWARIAQAEARRAGEAGIGRIGAVALAGAAVGAGLALWRDWAPWEWGAGGGAAALVAAAAPLLLLGAAARRLRRARRAAAVEVQEAQRAALPGWREAGAGLGRWFRWQLIRLAIAVAGGGLLIAIAAADGGETAGAIAGLLALVGLIAGSAIALRGLTQVSGIAPESGGRGRAGAALSLGLAALAFEVQGLLWLAGSVARGGAGPGETRLASAEIVATLLGLASLLALLGGLRRVARFLAMAELVRRARRAFWLVLALPIGALVLPVLAAIAGGGAVGLLLFLLWAATAIFALVAVLGLSFAMGKRLSALGAAGAARAEERSAGA
jgi:hypothetical protein